MIRRLVRDDAEEFTALLVANREFLAPYVPDQPGELPHCSGAARADCSSRAPVRHPRRRRVAGIRALSNLVHGSFQSASLGYWVDEVRNRRKLATRAVSAIVEITFGELGLHRLEAGTLVDNISSRRVLEKNHFSRIGVAPRHLRIAGEWRDHVLFQRTAED